jgi:tetratricopeptide (TPR) repeat protein
MESLINRVVAGRILRQARIAKGLTQENCAMELGISAPTLSRIEKGSKQPRLDTIKKYANFLECDIQQTHYHAETEIATALQMQEHQLNFNLERNNQIDIGEDHPYRSYSLFLDAKEAFTRGDYEVAEQRAKDAIEFHREELKRHNILAASANLLSLISYKQNRLIDAIHYIDLGIDHFQRDGERFYLYPMLLSNKGTYLEKLGHILDAGEIVNELMAMINNIPRIHEKLNAYELKVRYELARGQYDQAIHYGEIGLRLSSENGLKANFFEFATVLGEIYHDIGEYQKAKNAFRMALFIEKEVDDKKLVASLYTSLGRIYLEEGKMNDAKVCLDEAMGIFKKQNYKGPRYIDTMVAVGEYWLHTHKQKAIEILEKAYSLAEHQESKPLQKKIAKLLSLCYEENERKFSYYAKVFIQLTN